MYRLEYKNNCLFNTLSSAQGHSEEACYGYRKKNLKKNIEFLSGLTFEVRNITRGLEFKEENISKINW